MAKEDEDLRKVFERYEKLLFKAANSTQTENPYSFVKEFSKKVDAATVNFKQLAKRYIDRSIPEVNFSAPAETVLKRAGAFHETANVKLTTYVQMVSKLTDSAEQFKDRIQSRITDDEKNGVTTTVANLKDYIGTELRSGAGIEVTYSNGARMPTDKYAEMLARTTRTETQNLSMIGKALDDGNDLVEMSYISPTCDLCAMYQKRIYSVSGNTPGYPSLYDTAFKNGYSCVHPNCRHQVFPYNPKFHTAEERKELEEATRRSFGTANQQSEAARAAYARSQMQMRHWNKEMNEFAKMQEKYGTEAPYKTLGAFRRAYRSEEGSLSYAKTHYYHRDERQLESFQAVLGKENVPKTLAEFQEIKYNKNNDRIEKLKSSVADEIIRSKLGTDEYPLQIHADKQGKHIPTAKTFDKEKSKSFIAISDTKKALEFSQQIVDKYHGKGEMQRDLKGEWKHTELIESDKVIGFVTDKDGKLCQTKRAIIHYSKTGTHIVPTLRRFKSE